MLIFLFVLSLAFTFYCLCIFQLIFNPTTHFPSYADVQLCPLQGGVKPSYGDLKGSFGYFKDIPAPPFIPDPRT